MAQTVAPAPAPLTREQGLALETALADLNFDPGQIDGTIDARTESAIRLYQEFAALPTDGLATPALLEEVVSVARAFAEMRAAPPVEAAPNTAVPPGPEVADPALPKPDVPEPGVPELALPGPLPSELTREAPPAAPAEASPAAPILEAAAPEAPTPEALTPEALTPEALTPEGPAAPPRGPPEAAEPPPAEALVPLVELPGDRAGPDASAPVAEAPKSAAVETPAAAPALTRSEPAPVPEPKRLPDESARGFDIGGVISRLAKAGKNADKPTATGSAAAPKPPSATPRGGQVARAPAAAPAPPRARVGSSDGYAAFRDAYQASQAGDFERAADRYTEAIKSNKLTLEHLGDAYFNRANALHLLGRYDESIESYDAAIGSKPAFAGAYYNRGFAYEAKGERRHAVEDYRRARDLGLQRLGVRAPDRPPPLR